ncbi:CHAD domain-containing protein [Agromyces sp. NPDC056965]|uniref:CHAD domain-containing protein n=1 Tax=Agromyces sp. NPDC056965 TaxID=3345983 RepID=UPI003645C7DC
MDLVDADGDAGAVVLAVLRATGERLDELQPAAVADEPDAVHRLRTTVRRLRSVLAAYGPLFDVSKADEVSRRYRELGRRLGTVRDLEVRLLVAEEALQLAAASADFDPAELGRVAAGIVAETAAAHHLAHQGFVEHQRRPEADRRRATLDELLSAAPSTRLAGAAARPVLGAFLAHEARRAVARASEADAASTPAQLHGVRRACRRLRYAAEALGDGPGETLGAPALRLAAAGQGIQDLLGAHRDQMLFAEYLRSSATASVEPGGEPRALEQLAEAAEERAAERIADLSDAVRELRRAERDWLSL